MTYTETLNTEQFKSTCTKTLNLPTGFIPVFGICGELSAGFARSERPGPQQV